MTEVSQQSDCLSRKTRELALDVCGLVFAVIKEFVRTFASFDYKKTSARSGQYKLMLEVQMRSVFTGTGSFGLLCLLTTAIFLFAATTVGAQPAGCPPGMTGYWQFDEAAGPTYDDFFGVNDAACTNCPATVIGKIGNGLDFDGINDGVDVADDDSFDWNATSFTIEFWMRSSGCVCTTPVNGYTCNQVIVARTNASWWIGVNCETGNVGKLRCYFGNVDLYSNVFVGDDVWHHVVFQYDNSAGQYRLYIDGSLDNSVSAAGANRAGTAPITLGYFSGAYRYYGLLDEFALYNSALSQGEIQNHFTAGASGQGYCNAPAAAVIVSAPVTTATVGQAYSYDVNATGTPAPAYSLLTAPAGMTIDGITGVISWTPLFIGSFNVLVQASNINGSDVQSFTVKVDPICYCTPGLTHYWKLEETTGSSFLDCRGGNNANCGNCPTPIAGHIGGAQAFDRTDDGLNVADDPGFDWSATASYSIEFWMNETSTCAGATQPNNEVIVGRSGAGWWIGVNCESPLPVQRIRAYLQTTELFSTTVVNDGLWHHVVFVRDAAAGAFTLYVDNVAEATLVTAGKNLAGSDSLTIGYFNGPAPGKYRYGGILDELAFYNLALTPQAIDAHYNHGVGGRYCYVCGDADATGAVNVSDVVYLINFIFAGGNAPQPLASGDADCSGFITISDAVYLIGFIFSGGPAPCATCP